MNTVLWDIVGIVLWSGLLASIVMSIIGIASRIWWLLLIAAGMSLVFSIAGVWSIGWMTLWLSFIQSAAAVAIRFSAAWWGWGALLSAGCLAWFYVLSIGPWAVPL